VPFDPGSCREADRNIEECLGRQNIASVSASFNPDSQFWSFQLIESTLFLIIGLAVLGIGGMTLRRRLL
jgi:hypothetical protein